MLQAYLGGEIQDMDLKKNDFSWVIFYMKTPIQQQQQKSLNPRGQTKLMKEAVPLLGRMGEVNDG